MKLNGHPLEVAGAPGQMGSLSLSEGRTTKAPRTCIIKIAASKLRIHPTAQRALSLTKVKQKEKNFDLDAIGVLHAVKYAIDGVTRIWIVDGQHRLALLMRLGLGDWEVDVMVHLDIQDDAGASALFLELDDQTTVSPYDKFVNAAQAGHEDAIAIFHILESHGLKLSKTSDDGAICCVDTLRKIYHYDGDGTALDAAIDTAIAAWGSVAEAVQGALLAGLALVYRHRGGVIERAVMVKKLAKYPGKASALLGEAHTARRARQHHLIPRCVAQCIIEVYNDGKRGRKLAPL